MARPPAFPELAAFLAQPVRPEGTLSYHEVQGLLFAVACAPDVVMPPEWIPIIFNDHNPNYDDIDQANDMLGHLMALYNEVMASARGDEPALPPDCVFRLNTLANLDPDAPVAQWSRGFIAGHSWLEELWDPAFTEADDAPSPFGATLLTLSFFSSRSMAEEFCAEITGATLSTMAGTMRRLLPGTMREYARLGRSIEEARRHAATPVTHDGPQVGRNDACPCGSGKKYKKCCGTDSGPHTGIR